MLNCYSRASEKHFAPDGAYVLIGFGDYKHFGSYGATNRDG